MSSDRFHELAAAYGADPLRWPAHERELHARHAHTAAGAAALADAAAVDALLDALEARADDPLRPARIVRTARADARRKRRAFAWASGAWAASAVLGFMLGYLQPASEPDVTDDSFTQLLTGNTVMEDLL